MAESNTRQSMKADPEFLRHELDLALARGACTELLAGRIRILSGLFQNSESVPLDLAVKKLFPANDLRAGSVNFRKFKERLNRFLSAVEAGVSLESTPGTAQPEKKLVWFENRAPGHAALREGVEHAALLAEAIVRTLPQTGPEPVDTEVIIRRIPCITFPDQVQAFGRDLFGGRWRDMPESERSFYCKLSAKLEPIRQLSPHPEQPRETVGFEMLALDEAGRSFTSIHRFIKRKQYDPAMHYAVMIYVAMLTIQYVRFVLPLRDRRILPGGVFFTINLAPYMVGHPMLSEVFRAIKPLAPGNFLLEVSEKLMGDKVDELLRFQDAFGFKLALDDLDELDPGVRRALESHVAMTKVGFRKSRQLLALRDTDPEAAMRGLRSFKLPGRPMVIEAVDEDLSQVFLYENWDPQWGELYAQGRDLSPGPLYEPYLQPLNQYHIRGGGFVLAADEKRTLHRDLFRALCCGMDILGCRETDQGLHAGFAFRSAAAPAFTIAVPAPGADPAAATADYIVTDQEPPQGMPDSRPRVTTRRLGAFLEACARALAAGQPLPSATDQIEPFIARHAPAPEAPADWPERPCQPNMTRTDGLDLLLRWGGIITDTEDIKDHSLPRTLALFGDTGAGKTTLVRRLALALWNDRDNAATPYPVLLDGARLAERTHAAMAAGTAPSLEQLIAWAAADAHAPGVSPAAVLDAVRAGRAVILCDAFDTLALPFTRSRSMMLMRNLRGAAATDCCGRLLVAARTHFFLDAMDEEERLLAGEPGAATQQRASGLVLAAYIEPLNRAQAAAMARRRSGAAAADAFLAALDARPELKTLCARPAMHAALGAAPGPLVPGAALLSHAVKAWLSRDDFIHQIRPDIKLRFMEALAVKLRQETDAALHYEGLSRWLRARLREEYPALESVDDFERLDNDLRAASFLIRNPGGFYRMAHPAFLDFFAARFLARGLSDGDPESLEMQSLTPAVLGLAAGIVLQPPFRQDVARATARILMHSSRNPDAAANALAFLDALAAHQQTS